MFLQPWQKCDVRKDDEDRRRLKSHFDFSGPDGGITMATTLTKTAQRRHEQLPGEDQDNNPRRHTRDRLDDVRMWRVGNNEVLPCEKDEAAENEDFVGKRIDNPAEY